MLNASVVDQDVDLSERRFRRFDHRLYRSRLAHVGAVVQRSDFVTLNLTLDLRDSIRRAEAIDHDVRAFARERARDAQANAASRARDQCSFAFQHFFESPSFLSSMPS